MTSPYSNPHTSPTPRPSFPRRRSGPKTKPVSITAFGVLHLHWGVLSLGLYGYSIVVLMFFVRRTNVPPSNPMLDQLGTDYTWTFVSLAVGTLLTLLMMAAGVLLLAHNWLGRVLTILYGWIAIGFGMIDTIIQGFISISGLLSFGAIEEELDLVLLLMTYVFPLCLCFIAMIYPGLAIFFMTRNNVKDYLQPVG